MNRFCWQLSSLSGAQVCRRASWVNVIVPVPPPAEQKEIVAAIDVGLQTLFNQESMISKQIDHLTEYRSALITAAVTGEIDVRDWQPPEAYAAEVG